MPHQTDSSIIIITITITIITYQIMPLVLWFGIQISKKNREKYVEWDYFYSHLFAAFNRNVLFLGAFTIALDYEWRLRMLAWMDGPGTVGRSRMPRIWRGTSRCTCASICSDPISAAFIEKLNVDFYFYSVQAEDAILREQINRYNDRLREYEERQRQFRGGHAERGGGGGGSSSQSASSAGGNHGQPLEVIMREKKTSWFIGFYLNL